MPTLITHMYVLKYTKLTHTEVAPSTCVSAEQ